MQSNNPVFRRSEEFNSANAYGNQTYAGNGGYTDPATWNVGQPGQSAPSAPPVATGGPMTIDSVVQKTAIALFVVIVTAGITWAMAPDIDADTTSGGNQKFHFIKGQQFHDEAGELRFSGRTLQGDVNGDGKADFEIKVFGIGSLLAGDFNL